MDAKKVVALAIAVTFMALSFSGCLDNNDGSNDGGSSDGAGGDSPPTQCAKPWPSKIDMIQVPDSMIVGETYTFQCQMFVQNYDDNCIPSPWWYAVDTPIEWTFANGDGAVVTNESMTNNPYGIASVNFSCPSAGNWTVIASWAGNANYVQAEGQANVSATLNYWFTNLSFDGYWPMESNGQRVSLSPTGGQFVGQPAAGFDYNESRKTNILNSRQGYYFWLDADTQQAYIDWLKANGFNHSNSNKIPSMDFAEWRIVISSPGISTDDAVMYSGWGYPSQALVMSWKQFIQGTDSVNAHLEYIPSWYSMTRHWWDGMHWTDADVVIANFPAMTPAAIQFQRAGTYSLSFYLADNGTGEAKSPVLTTSVTVVDSSSCDKPWPSTVEIINRPGSMIAGQSYTFQARMMVQNFDAHCNPTPWYYATNTPISWIFRSSSGATTDLSVTAGSGVATITFTPTQVGTYSVIAQWAGNDAYAASSSAFNIYSSQAGACSHPWPAWIEWGSHPSSMIQGQTYTFTAQMWVQNRDGQCNPTPWYYATNTPITWTFSNPNGQLYTYETTTASDGTSSVSFQCPGSGTWTVSAYWAGNDGYALTGASMTVQAI